MKNLKANKIAALLIITLCLGLMFISTVQSGENSPASDANKLTGKVTDAYTSVPLAGATVQVKGTDVKALTAKDGTYSLELPKGAKHIVISLTNYRTLEIEIKGRKVINTVLSPGGTTNPIWG